MKKALKGHKWIMERKNALNISILIGKNQFGGCFLISDIKKDPSMLKNLVGKDIIDIMKKLKIIPYKNKTEENNQI